MVNALIAVFCGALKVCLATETLSVLVQVAIDSGECGDWDAGYVSWLGSLNPPEFKEQEGDAEQEEPRLWVQPRPAIHVNVTVLEAGKVYQAVLLPQTVCKGRLQWHNHGLASNRCQRHFLAPAVHEIFKRITRRGVVQLWDRDRRHAGERYKLRVPLK